MKNTTIKRKMLINLRPITKNGLPPYQVKKILNKKAKKNIEVHEEITWKKIV